MARPQIPPEQRRTKQVKCVLSPMEFSLVQDRASKLQTTPADFVRNAALNKPLRVTESTAVDFETRNELRRIGVNLNQIARVLNAGGEHDSDDLSTLCGKLDNLFDMWLNHDPQSRKVRP